MERKSFVLLVVGMVVFFLCSVASADVPDSINYQGKLTTAAGGCVNDTVQMTFSIYPDTLPGTSADWTETQMQVVVKDGIFDVLLGSVTPLPASLFDGNAKYLGVQVESDAEMRPLKPMVSVAYAFRSEFSDTAEYARAAPAMPDDDWVIDGDNIYHELGNVGIGTTSPGTYKLNVNGTGYFGAQLNIMDPNYYLQLSGSDARIIFDSGSDWFRFDRTNNAYDFIIAADKVFSAKSASQYLRGNVGIGTLTPTQKLDVAGTAQMTGFKMPTDASTGRVLTSDASGVGTWQTPPSGIGGSGTTNYIPKFTAPTTIGNSVIYESGGSIGIGTTIPPTRLSVIGLTPSSGYYPLRYNPGNGAIYFQPSSKRYKRDIQSLEDDFFGILRAEPKSFVDATSGEREIGFIAEEFDALGLRNLVIYLDGQPNGIKYEMISLYLLEVVKELKARNEDLQRRIEALEAR